MIELHGISSVGENGRCSVRLQDGSLLSFKPANLRQLDTLHRSHSQGQICARNGPVFVITRPECWRARWRAGAGAWASGEAGAQQQDGTAAGWDNKRGRYSVRLQDRSTAALKPANLRKVCNRENS